MAERGDESGVWEVMACASAAHVERVNELEKLRTEVNEFREKEKLLHGGVFGSESSRVGDMMPGGTKRKSDDISEHVHDSGSGDIFEEFSRTLMKAGGNQGIFAE